MKKPALILALSLFAMTAQAKPTEVVLTKSNVVVFNDVFDGPAVARCLQKARELDSALPSGEPIYLVLDTPGGSIEAGINMIDVLAQFNRPVHTITLFAASMGFQTMQGLGDRLILERGTAMSHKARGGFQGEFGGSGTSQLDARYTHYLKRVNALDEQAVKRTKGKHTIKSYHSLIENEYWGDGEDVVKNGFADKVVTVKCDKTLNGVRNETIKGNFMGMSYTVDFVWDACPMASSPIDTDVKVGGLNSNERAALVAKGEYGLRIEAEQAILLQKEIDGVIAKRMAFRNRSEMIMKLKY